VLKEGEAHQQLMREWQSYANQNLMHLSKTNDTINIYHDNGVVLEEHMSAVQNNEREFFQC
jgi:hypothetical protein